MAGPGPRNLITDVAGLKVGQAEDPRVRTGVSVLLGDEPFMAVGDIRGGAPGTRDVEALEPTGLVEAIDAICLSGGSAFGLDAPGGVQSVLASQGRGFEIASGVPLVPVVAGAILFDLANGGDKDWGAMPPYRALGEVAAAEAAADFRLGNVGAGYGAIAGSCKGGIGSASWVTEDGFTVGALVAVNAVGSPLMPGSNVFWAWPFEQADEFGGRQPKAMAPISSELPADMKGAEASRENTTIAIVATDAALTKVELKRLAIMATDGFARALRPVHTPFDGDLLFAVSTTKKKIGQMRPRDVMRLGHAGGDCLARAIARGVYEAETLGSTRSYRDLWAG
jgi:L-aminopeptidase/D-esterase-like protein